MEFLRFEEMDDLDRRLIRLVKINCYLYNKKVQEFKIVVKREVWAIVVTRRSNAICSECKFPKIYDL